VFDRAWITEGLWMAERHLRNHGRRIQNL
jgi:hypothetical protein